MQERKNFKIYRSSAGSGKTYTLTKEYLKLALKSPAYYKSILAVTFTNRATQEMKSRILQQLHGLSQDKSTEMLSELIEATDLQPSQLKARSQEVLTKILHGYSQFSVSTIDSFFQKVIRAFTREIGLQAGFTLELDQQKVLDEVIDLVFEDIGKDKQLTEWLVRFAEEKVEQGKNWDFRKDIKQLAREVFQEHYKSFEKDIASAASRKDFVPQLLNKLKYIITTYQNAMRDCGTEALKVAEQHGLEVGDFSYGKGGVMGYLQKITESEEFVPGSRANKSLGNPENWHTKNSPKKEAIAKAVLAGLDNCLGKALDLYQKDHKRYESARQVMRFIYTFGILANITQKLQKYRDDNDLMLISDAAVFLKDIVADNDAPFVYEKIGNTYNHYLIDEFQDTSGFQWENFKPLVVNSLAEGNMNLVVGDVKQSIYRWRGGDWQLLLEKIVKDVGANQTQELNLNQNWRSRRNIIEFNNGLFAGSPSILETLSEVDLKDIEDEQVQNFLKKEASKIATAYKDVYQEYPHVNRPSDNEGYINFTFLPSKEVDDDIEQDESGSALESLNWKEAVLNRIPDLVTSFQDQGYALNEIAFLVRNKNDGKLIADRLVAYKSLPEADPQYSYEVISSESLMVGAAVSVNMILNTLRYFDNPEDIIAKVNMVYDYQVYVLNRLDINLHQLYTEVSSTGEFYEWMPRGFEVLEQQITKYPLYEIVETLIRTFELHTLQGEYAYIQAFQDLVLNYGKKEQVDIASFMKWWEEIGVNNAVQVSDATDAMKILTIHKSKGLQFKVVIVPFCDWHIDHSPIQQNTLWCCADDPPFNEIPYLPLSYSSKLKSTIYHQNYYEEMVKAFIDALNLLYVAFTRAEDCLVGFGPLPGFKKNNDFSIRKISDLLYKYFSDNFNIKPGESIDLFQKTFWDPESHNFEMGKRFDASKVESKSPANIINLRQYLSTSWRNRLSIKPRARNFYLERETPAVAKINFGLLMHEILAQVKYKADLPGVMQKFVFDGLISEQERTVLENKLHQVFKEKEVDDWFSEKWEVKTEVPVLPASGRINRLDRVMIKDKEAIVVDFKSGNVESKHKKQVENYISLLDQMGYKKVSGYILYLEPVSIVKVL